MKVRKEHLLKVLTHFEDRPKDALINVAIGGAGLMIIDDLGSTTVFGDEHADERPVYVDKDVQDKEGLMKCSAMLQDAEERRAMGDYLCFMTLEVILKDLEAGVDLDTEEFKKLTKRAKEAVERRKRANEDYLRLSWEINEKTT